MGFADVFLIEPAPMAAFNRLDEVDSLARDKIAERMQLRVRGSVDPGMDLRSAVSAQALQVNAQGDRFVTERQSQGSVLEPEEAVADDDANEVTDIDQLFQMSSGVPTVRDGKLVYRTISPSVLLGRTDQVARKQVLDQTVTSAIEDSLADSFEDAFQEVQRRNPSGV